MPALLLAGPYQPHERLGYPAFTYFCSSIWCGLLPFLPVLFSHEVFIDATARAGCKVVHALWDCGHAVEALRDRQLGNMQHLAQNNRHYISHYIIIPNHPQLQTSSRFGRLSTAAVTGEVGATSSIAAKGSW